MEKFKVGDLVRIEAQYRYTVWYIPDNMTITDIQYPNYYIFKYKLSTYSGGLAYHNIRHLTIQEERQYKIKKIIDECAR